MPDYWFHSLANGERVVERTLAAINKRAQREADKFGQGVQVFSGAAGRKSHRRVSMARNPAGRKSPKSKVAKAHALMVYGDGRREASHGGKKTANPYPKASYESDMWLKGFNSWAAVIAKKMVRNPDYGPGEAIGNWLTERADARRTRSAAAERKLSAYDAPPARRAVAPTAKRVHGKKAVAPKSERYFVSYTSPRGAKLEHRFASKDAAMSFAQKRADEGAKLVTVFKET